MAETATTTSFPSWRVLATRRATFRIRFRSPTEVPPYFCTIRATLILLLPFLPQSPDKLCFRAFAGDHEFSLICAHPGDPDLQPLIRQDPRNFLGPFQEGNSLPVNEFLPTQVLQFRGFLEAVKIGMIHGKPAPVLVNQ